MNFATEDVASGIIRDRAKSGASLADVDPMNIDRSVSSPSTYNRGFVISHGKLQFSLE